MNPLQRKIMQARLRRRQDTVDAINAINTHSSVTNASVAQRQAQTEVLQDVLSGNTPSLQTIHDATNKDAALLSARKEVLLQGLSKTKDFPMWAKILLGIVGGILLILIIAIAIKS